MTERNKINVIYEDLTPDLVKTDNGSFFNIQYDLNSWMVEIRCLEGFFVPSGKFVHAERE